MKSRIPRKLKKKIPVGHYCYEGLWFEPETGIYHIKSCYFFSYIKCKDKPVQDEIDKEFPEEKVGWCKLIKDEIMDQCKSCGLNYGKY